MNLIFDHPVAHADGFRTVLSCIYVLAALALPLAHVRPILRYVRGSGGIGDACLRAETMQCVARVPALLFAIFVVVSLPLFLSVALDLSVRICRVLVMHRSHRRWRDAHDKSARLPCANDAKASLPKSCDRGHAATADFVSRPSNDDRDTPLNSH